MKTLLKKNLDKSRLVPFVIFLVLHVILININSAEWGDSYRILRAAVHLREDVVYPVDEKRPPLFSLILATYPKLSEGAFVDPVIWGRILMLVISLLSYYVFSLLIDKLLGNKQKSKRIALFLFALNPVYLYWSIRIMADVPFTLFVLLAMYLVTLYKDKPSLLLTSTLGIIVGLSIYTRFEGYILFGAIGLGILFVKDMDLNKLLDIDFISNSFSKNIKYILSYSLSTFVVLLPYFVWRNPLTSSYFEEPSGRAYDLTMLMIYVVSLLFLFGFVAAPFFAFRGKELFKKYFSENIAIASFVLVELLLVLSWPAAVPRLFVPIVPLLIIPLASSIHEYFAGSTSGLKQVGSARYLLSKVGLFKKLNGFNVDIQDALLLLFVFMLFVVGQFVLRLQFLVVVKSLFALIALLQLGTIGAILYRKYNVFLILGFVSLVIWSLSTIWVHKDIHKVVKEANEFVASQLCGKVASNDVSSVTDWYQNESPVDSCANSFYYDLTIKENREIGPLVEHNVDYALVTNEHNTEMTLDITPWPHLEMVAEFVDVVNGKTFFTRIIKFNK